MPVCKRYGCQKLVNRLRANGLYCCRACMLDKGHGPACQTKLERSKSRDYLGVTSVKIISWGSSKYGNFIVFKFKTDIPPDRPLAINYKMYDAPNTANSIIAQGTLRYSPGNSQIIFTQLNIIDNKISLEISLELDGYTTSDQMSPLTNLSSKPYKNCNYFTRTPFLNQDLDTVLIDFNPNSRVLTWNATFTPDKFNGDIFFLVARVSNSSCLNFSYFNTPGNIVYSERGSGVSATVDFGFDYAVMAAYGNRYLFSNVIQA